MVQLVAAKWHSAGNQPGDAHRETTSQHGFLALLHAPFPPCYICTCNIIKVSMTLRNRLDPTPTHLQCFFSLVLDDPSHLRLGRKRSEKMRPWVRRSSASSKHIPSMKMRRWPKRSEPTSLRPGDKMKKGAHIAGNTTISVE